MQVSYWICRLPDQARSLQRTGLILRQKLPHKTIPTHSRVNTATYSSSSRTHSVSMSFMTHDLLPCLSGPMARRMLRLFNSYGRPP